LFSAHDHELNIGGAQWRSQKFVMEGVLAPPPLPFPFIAPFSRPLPSLPLEVGPLKSS